MNILYVGAESANWIVMLCNEICKLGHTVTCIVQTHDEYDKQNPVKPHQNLRIFDIPFNTFLNIERLHRIISKHLENGKYDIVFGSHAPISPAVVKASKDFDIPSGIMLLDIPTDLMNEDPWRMNLWKTAFPWIKNADLIITNTEVCAGEVYNFLNRTLDKEDVITYGIHQHPLFKKTGINTEKPYVVSVCRLSPIKNCILIPKALKEANLELKYVAVGKDYGQLSEITKYCEENEIEFEYLGSVSEYKKFEIIQNASMLIYPQKTPYIGGLSPFEAMYVGTPSIVPNLQIFKDLYEDNSYFFNNNDEKSLAKTITSVYNNKDAIFLEKAHLYALEESSFSTMAKKLIERMKTVIR